MQRVATRIFKGFALADALNAATRERVASLSRRPACTILLDARDAGMRAYGERLGNMAAEAGIALDTVPYAADADAVLRQMRTLAADAHVDAIAPLYPLPEGVDAHQTAMLIGPDKDADGLHPHHAGALAQGHPERVPATARACLLCAQAVLGSLAGLDVVIVGASRIVGRPLAHLLLDKDATVSIAHAATRDLAALTRRADLVVSATGVPGLIGRDHVRAGATLVDVGISRTEAGLVGDVDVAAIEGVAAAVTHVPDGVGPVTTACLLANVAEACMHMQ